MNYEPDDFDTQVQPEELQDDNPIDGDYYMDEFEFDHYDRYDEGSDRDNWEDEQCFQDREWE